MKRFILVILLAFIPLTLQAKKSTIRFNGVYESTFSFAHSRTYSTMDYGYFNWGWKNFGNLRVKAKIGEYATFGISFNTSLNTGSFASDTTPDPTGFTIPFSTANGTASIGSLVLDRFYFKAGNEYFDIEAGVIRFARGFGYSFSPTDFFNPVNPLDPEARKQGKLAFVATIYPLSMWKMEFFALAPDNLVEQKGWGWKFGLATNFYLTPKAGPKSINFEFLYTFFLPEIEYLKTPSSLMLPDFINNDFSHVLGFSLKTDIEVGLFIDAIYRLDHKVIKSGSYYGKPFYGYEGLQAAIGVDYTVAGRVYMLIEYMFFGSGMLDWWNSGLDGIYSSTASHWSNYAPLDRLLHFNPEKKPLSFQRHDYIFGLIRVKVNDYLWLGNTYLFGADDQSAIFTTFAQIEPFQAFSIKITGMLPLDWHMIDSSKPAGEFGSLNLGFLYAWSISASVRF